MEEKETKSISFKDIGGLLKANLVLIVVILAISIAISGAYAFLFQKTNYTASVMLEVCLKENGEEDNLAESSIYSFARYLSKGYKVLFSSSAYLAEANNEENHIGIVGNNLSYNIDDELDVLFTVSYTVSNKGTPVEEMKLQVAKTLNDYIDFAKSKIDSNELSVYAGRLNIVSYAEENTVKASKGTVKTFAIGVLAGIVIAFIVILIKFMSDDTVGEKEDVELLTETTVIAFIPLVHSDSSKSDKFSIR